MKALGRIPCTQRAAGLSRRLQRSWTWHLRAPACTTARLPPKALLPSIKARDRAVVTRAQANSDVAAKKPSFPERFLSLLPSLECFSVLKQMWQLLCKHLWAVVLIYAIKDSLQFLLHRVTHRLTNYVAEAVFSYPISEEAINSWWLVLDQEFIQQYPGYQVVMALFFLLAMPLNLLLTGVAGASTALVCAPPTTPAPPTPQQPSIPSSISTPTADDPAPDRPGSSTEAPPASSSAPPSSSTAAQPAAASSETSSSSNADSSTPSDDPTPATSTSAPSNSPSNPTASTSSNSPDSVDPQRTARQSAVSPPEPSSTSTTSTSSTKGAAASAKKKGWFAPITNGWREAANSLPLVGGMLGRVWWTESVVAVIGLALQAGMMLVVTVPWLLPIYLSAQLSGITCIFKGDSGLKAINSSAAMLKGKKRVVFWPLLALILGVRAVDSLKVTVFAAMPQRLWSDAMELPIAAYIIMQGLRIVVSRLQDLLPIGMYLYLLSTQSQAASEEPETTTAAAAAST